MIEIKDRELEMKDREIAALKEAAGKRDQDFARKLMQETQDKQYWEGRAKDANDAMVETGEYFQSIAAENCDLEDALRDATEKIETLKAQLEMAYTRSARLASTAAVDRDTNQRLITLYEQEMAENENLRREKREREQQQGIRRDRDFAEVEVHIPRVAVEEEDLPTTIEEEAILKEEFDEWVTIKRRRNSFELLLDQGSRFNSWKK